MLSTQLSYEATKNDTSGEKVSTWQMTVGWNRLENDFYIYPFTVKQYTGALPRRDCVFFDKSAYLKKTS